MKVFQEREVCEAIKHALAGEQVLHLQRPSPNLPGVPLCFRRAKEWGHLLDQDARRLARTARQLGVRRIVVAHRGERTQHVDLCGKPLARAKEKP